MAEGRNPFNNLLWSFDRGGGINPFAALRDVLPQQLFNQAGVFGQQSGGFLNSRGMFDPNLAEAMRLKAFGGAQDTLAQALAQLAGQEGQFKEGQRRFNIGTETQLTDMSAQWDAAQPGWMDYALLAAQLGMGLGTFGSAGGFGAIGKGLSGLMGLFGGGNKGWGSTSPGWGIGEGRNLINYGNDPWEDYG